MIDPPTNYGGMMMSRQAVPAEMLKIDHMVFEVARVDSGENAVFEYRGGDQFGGAGLRGSSRSLNAIITEEDAPHLILLRIDFRKQGNLTDMSGVVTVSGQNFFIRRSWGGTPLVFERIGFDAYVPLLDKQSGSPRTLYQIVQDFELGPEFEAFVFARQVGVSA